MNVDNRNRLNSQLKFRTATRNPKKFPYNEEKYFSKSSRRRNGNNPQKFET